MKTKKIISLLTLLIICSVFTLSGAICKEQATMPAKVVLEYWRVFEDQDSMAEIISSYQTLYPYVEIRYKKFRFEEYADALIEAWAKDEGPDVFSVPNYWVGAYLDFAEPLPTSTTMQQVAISANLSGQQEITLTPKTNKSYNVYNLNNYFVDVVSSDVVVGENIYGLPLGLDALALYYNTNLLNQANIALPPQTWEEFVATIPRLTLLDADGEIVQAGAAMGAAENVPRSQDILSLLMMQSGATMTNDSGTRITFANESTTQGGYFPAERALQFYLDFSNPSKEAYTWNPDMTDALSQFTQGNLAYFFGYSYHNAQIKAAAGSSLKYNVTTMPQISLENRVNYANYLVEMVSNKSANSNVAWDFIKYASRQENVTSYLDVTGRPTALKSLITKQLEDYQLAPFAASVLTAKSWYHGRKPDNAESVMHEMINWVLDGEATIKEAVEVGASQIQTTL